MIRNNRFNNRNFYSLAVATLLLVVTFALIGFVALSVLTGNSFDFANNNAADLAALKERVLPDLVERQQQRRRTSRAATGYGCFNLCRYARPGRHHLLQKLGAGIQRRLSRQLAQR